MDLSVFTERSPGSLVTIRGFDQRYGEEFEHKAFVPESLPLDLQIEADTWAAINGARESLGRLDEAIRFLPNPALLRRLIIRREAQSTSALEGTWAALSEVFEAEASAPQSRSAEVREVLNFVEVADAALGHVREHAITVAHLCELQRILVHGTPADDDQAGKVRTKLVVIGPKGVRIPDARFIPPPHELLEAGLHDWLQWLDADHDPIVRVALGHYQFETLHPFADGNGRIGRLLIVLGLVRAGLLTDLVLPVSPWLENRRADYQDGLLGVSVTGDFNTWVRLIAHCIESQARAVVNQVRELHGFRTRAHETVLSHKIKGVAERLADDLIGWPVIRIPDVRDRYEVTYMGAKHAVERLVGVGILEEVPSERSDRLFVNREVIRIVEGMAS